MIGQFLIILGVIALGIGYQDVALALDCEKGPEQTSRDWEGEVDTVVAKIGPVSGGKVAAKLKTESKDLLEKLPEAGKIYMELKMLYTYCSSLRDDKAIQESEKTQKLKEYIIGIRAAIWPKQPASVRPPSKQPSKNKTSVPQSKANPPVLPLTQAETKQPEMQKPQPAVSQNPSISQHSEGAYSLNITGCRNVVIINPISEAKLDEMSALLRQKVDQEKLRQKYPLGYLIFELNGNVVIPYETLSVLGEYQFEWTVVKVIQNTKDRIAIRLPDARRKDGSLAISEAMTGGKKQVGNLGGVSLGDPIVWGEILAIRENGVVFLVGFEKMPLSKLIKK